MKEKHISIAYSSMSNVFFKQAFFKTAGKAEKINAARFEKEPVRELNLLKTDATAKSTGSEFLSGSQKKQNR